MKALKRLRKDARTEKQKAETAAQWYEFCKRADAIILYTLWQDFGFGKARLEKFYKRFLINAEELYLRYDNNHADGELLDEERGIYAVDKTEYREQKGRERYAIVRDWLKGIGVDVEEWQTWDVAELMREEKENGKEVH